MRLAVRLAITVMAVVLVFGMGVHYDITEDQHWPYPDGDELAADYDAHVGETTLVWGTVESVDLSAETAQVRIEHSDGSFTLMVHDFDADIVPGGSVQILGILESGYEMTAVQVEVVNPSGGAELMKFTVSALGALLVLVVFFNRWRIDWDRYGFEVR